MQTTYRKVRADMDGNRVHEPVLLKEVIEFLAVRENGMYADCTLGDGGYSSAIARHLITGTLVSFDWDEVSIEWVRREYPQELKVKKWHLVRENYSKIREISEELGIDGYDGVVFDLGISSRQLDKDPLQRGFSYNTEQALDMRMDTRLGVSAEQLIRGLGERELVMIFEKFGEERYAKRIARIIKEWVNENPDNALSSDRVAALVRKVVPASYRNGSKHPARRVFQALRIAVNDELHSLQRGLSSALSIVRPRGRVIVISYHSLEDRIVKDTFAKSVEEDRYAYVCKKPFTPDEAEVQRNPRSRSAKMRIVERMQNNEN